MAMSKKDFIELANVIKGTFGLPQQFSDAQIETLADFCRSQNHNFMRSRWLSYIAGECGSNGGAIRKGRAA